MIQTKKLQIEKYIKYGIFFSSIFAVLAVAVDQFVFSKYSYLASANILHPEQYAQSLYDHEQYRDAQEYIDFYTSIPGVERTGQLDEIYSKADEQRHSLKYITRELAKGFVFGVSQEDYGRLAGFTSEMLVIGDVRDLSKAGYHWYQDGELDEFEKFIAAISAINVGIALVSIGPQAPTGVMAKTGTSILKIAHRTKNLTLPFVKNVIEIASNKTMIKTVIEPLKNLCEFAKTKGITATLSILSRIDSFTDLSKILKSAVALGDDMVMLLKYGGKNLFGLVDKFGASTVKRFAVYGQGAVNLLEKIPATKLFNDIQIFLKHTGSVFYTTLKLGLSIAEWLFPILFSLLSVIFVLIRKGVLMGAHLAKSAIEGNNISVQASEQKSSLQDNT